MIKGFSKLSKQEKIEKINNTNINFYQYKSEIQQKLDIMSENVISSFHLPYSVAPNLLLNNKEYIVPFVTEESSIVAACSKTFTTFYKYGGFFSELINDTCYGTIYLIGDFLKIQSFIKTNKNLLIEKSVYSHCRHIKDITCINYEDFIQILFSFNVGETMGANYINKVLESAGQWIKESISDINIISCILSNITDYTIRCRGMIELSELKNPNNFILLNKIAEKDLYRRATHNKGILNGIVSVGLSIGQDIRALTSGIIEKNEHLTKYTIDGKYLECEINLPLNIGIVGGCINFHPHVLQSLSLLNNPSKFELGGIISATGLAQNFAALKVLTEEGINAGHLKLHNIKYK